MTDILQILSSICSSSATPDAAGFVRVTVGTLEQVRQRIEELEKENAALKAQRLIVDDRIRLQRAELFNLNSAYNQAVSIIQYTEARLKKERDSLQRVVDAATAWRHCANADAQQAIYNLLDAVEEYEKRSDR